MLFPDYTETGLVYHIVSIIDLEKTLKKGIRYNDKVTYKTKYYDFHRLIEDEKPDFIPEWVVRSKAIFASLNFPDWHNFHSHSVVLAVKIKEDHCWIANENNANEIYEPFILQNVEVFSNCSKYLETEGKERLLKYWENSLSFKDNLQKRLDKVEKYDAEVLIFHDIMPEDIEIKYIISDHRMLTVNEWKERFCIRKN